MDGYEDVPLYQAISELLQEQRKFGINERRVNERRVNQRRPYPCSQLLPPFDGACLPNQTDFALVQCQDLSPHNFAFLSPQSPVTPFVVIALGRVPFKFFVAEVVRVERSSDTPDQQWTVGCRFVRRIVTDHGRLSASGA